MKFSVAAICAIFISAGVSPVTGLERPDMEFKIFQFPKDMIPRIDGKADDWAMVPVSYNIGVDELKDTVHNTLVDKNDLDVTVKVGWVNGLNRLYFLYEAYDDFWDFSSPGRPVDIFEVVVDGDLSGGSLLPTAGMGMWEGYLFQGVYAQNYHIFTPAEGKSWTAVWGCQPWVADLPWANAAYSYNFKHGQSGKLVLEFYITPFDYAPYQGASSAIPSKLEENKVIGLSWAVLDYDHQNASDYDGFYNLSQKTSMYGNASDLVAFRLMPIEAQFHKPIEAQWSFKIIDMDRSLVEFKDLSYGNITSWKWDFGDGTTSTEQNPIHRYEKPGTRYVVILYVEGPEGTARMSKVWDVAIRGDSVVSVDNAEKPSQFSLIQNYPNPFNPITTISFSLPQESRVNLTVYNLAGGKVTELVDSVFPAGTHNVEWNAQSFSSGMYLYQIKAGEFTKTKKLMLVK